MKRFLGISFITCLVMVVFIVYQATLQEPIVEDIASEIETVQLQPETSAGITLPTGAEAMMMVATVCTEDGFWAVDTMGDGSLYYVDTTQAQMIFISAYDTVTMGMPLIVYYPYAPDDAQQITALVLLEQSTQLDVLALYYEVLLDLWSKDTAMQQDATQIGLDLTGASNLESWQKAAIGNALSKQLQMPVHLTTYESLVEQKVIDSIDRVWEQGVLLRVQTIGSAVEEESAFHFEAMKWRSASQATFFSSCRAEYNGVSWQYVVGAEVLQQTAVQAE